MTGEERSMVQALRRLEARARADFRAGRVSWVECARVCRLVRETIGGG